MAKWTDPHVVLGIARGYEPGDLKQAYRRALLLYHPDKLDGAPERPPRYTVDDINEAYRMLKGGAGSADDERKLDTDGQVVNFNEVCDLGVFDEHELADGSMEWLRDCRCGQQGYRLTEQNLESNGDADEIAVQCSGCSLWILVQYAVE